MEEETKQPQLEPPAKRVAAAICEECKANPSKYKCPGCSIRSCSLPCVRSHKQRTGCTGKRDVTRFVPLSQFDNNLLLSDYNMLEEVKRVAESAQRMRNKLCRYSYFKLPFFLRSLRSAAASRRTKLLFLPSGMSKREKNQTRYDQRKKCISWTIEWRFHSTDVVLVDHGVSEDTTLRSVIEKHLTPGPWGHKLKQFCDWQLGSLKLFIRKYPKGAKSPFLELDINVPLRQQLANIIILEYPVIHVFLPSHSLDFEVVRDTNPVNTRPELKDSFNKRDESSKGVTFKEEEIKEEDISSFEPQVLDLFKQVNFSPVRQIPHGNKFEKGSNEASHVLKPGVTGNVESEFEQGLIDTYSELIADINPDGFLDLDGEFFEKMEVCNKDDLLNFVGAFPAEEELEEGEIVG